MYVERIPNRNSPPAILLRERLIDPASKLATARGLDDETATCSLGA
jgi:hypothetical protein